MPSNHAIGAVNGNLAAAAILLFEGLAVNELTNLSKS
jgi:hypothetical protein